MIDKLHIMASSGEFCSMYDGIIKGSKPIETSIGSATVFDFIKVNGLKPLSYEEAVSHKYWSLCDFIDGYDFYITDPKLIATILLTFC